MAGTDGEFPTTIGEDAVFKGELRFEKGVRLLGRFEGQIQSRGELLVAQGASLEGEVDAGNVKLEGHIKGNLQASGKVQLSATSKLEGDLTTARLEVADGAVFVGRCVVGAKDAAKGVPPKPSIPSHAPVETPKGKPVPQTAGKN
jgi:cytoskeletal protein CcmA (bactofilin family)